MDFSEQLERFLPADVPNRENLVRLGARHLELIVEANQQFNLTRIVSPVEAAIKHTVDSVMPWKLLQHPAGGIIVDAGSGAGFPGIPLAIVLPKIRFVLLESIQKKARFLASTVATLELPNVTVLPERAEDWLKKNRAGIVTARAVAPLVRALPLFDPAVKRGSRLILYKGPDIASEISELPPRARSRVKVLERYTLPEEMGSRTLVEVLPG